MTSQEQALSLVQMAQSDLKAATLFAKAANIFALFFDLLPTQLRQQLDNNLI